MRGRHRRPRPVRDFFVGLWLLVLVSRYSQRHMRRAVPQEIQKAATMIGTLPWSVERIPLQVSPEEHWRGVRVIEEYATSGPQSAWD